MLRMSVALVVVLALAACSKGDGDASSGNASAPASNQSAPASFSPSEKNPKHPELRVAEADRKAYADLFSCRFQLNAMETKSMDVTGAFADKVAVEFKSNPNAFKECLATLQQKQAAYSPPGTPPAEAPSAGNASSPDR